MNEQSWRDESPQCDNCGSHRLRWETSHTRCLNCGHIIPCCEGAPLPG